MTISSFQLSFSSTFYCYIISLCVTRTPFTTSIFITKSDFFPALLTPTCWEHSDRLQWQFSNENYLSRKTCEYVWNSDGICLTSYVPSGQSASGTRLISKVPTLEAIKKKRKELIWNYLFHRYDLQELIYVLHTRTFLCQFFSKEHQLYCISVLRHYMVRNKILGILLVFISYF